MEAGAGLCKENAVRTIYRGRSGKNCRVDSIRDALSEREIPRSNGARELDLGKEGGHSKRRILHAKDVTGREIEQALLAAIAEQPNISIFENHFAIDLITSEKLGYLGDNTCLGVYVLDKTTGAGGDLCGADHVAGHWRMRQGLSVHHQSGHRYRRRRGDGLRAGAAVANMEFIQFHPTCLYHPKAKSFFDQRGGEGWKAEVLKSIEGREFMDGYHRLKSLAPPRHRGPGNRQ